MYLKPYCFVIYNHGSFCYHLTVTGNSMKEVIVDGASLAVDLIHIILLKADDARKVIQAILGARSG